MELVELSINNHIVDYVIYNQTPYILQVEHNTSTPNECA